MKKIAILGSTGSIGKNTLAVIRNFPKRFSVQALCAKSNIGLLYQQIREFHPKMVCVIEPLAGLKLKTKIKSCKVKIYIGKEGLDEIIKDKQIDKIVLAITGKEALFPLLKAIDYQKEIALANKEALVAAGEIIMRRAKQKNVKIIPVDSEQSAIWQCLNGQDRSKLKNIYLTASGGPFRNKKRKELKDVSIRQVLKHPRWRMGKKITVDSATLMNKGLEVLETMYLFGISPEKIKVIIHPQAIIHSLVEFIDGIVLAQLSFTDMRIPIQYALSYPERLSTYFPRLDFFKIKEFNFEKPNFKQFPCLALAYEAAYKGGTYPAVLNAANEVSVEAFLKKRLDFISIPKIISKVLISHKNILNPNLEDILRVDSWAREEAENFIKKEIN